MTADLSGLYARTDGYQAGNVLLQDPRPAAGVLMIRDALAYGDSTLFVEVDAPV
eukprot:gene8348-4120_t